MSHPLVLLLLSGLLLGAEMPTKLQIESAISEAQAWCLTQQQKDGSFSPDGTFAIGVTALTTLALLDQPGLAKDDPIVARAVAFVMGFRRPDGGFYDPAEGLGNYGTSLALRLLIATDGDPAVIAGARDWILGKQNLDPDSDGFGGFEYGDKGPGHEDLSNATYGIRALREAGVGAEDPKLQAALKFLERCQDLTEVNPAAWAGKDPEGRGGAVYSPAEAGGSWEEREQGGREEKFSASGTMTYSLLSSYLTLELSPDDHRVQAALGYLRRHYGFAANPGMPAGKERQGLFNYFGLMGRTFDLLAIDTLELPEGGPVDWRADLWQHLMAESTVVTLDDGKPGRIWINSASRWGEGMPNLSTVYALHALKAIHHRL